MKNKIDHVWAVFRYSTLIDEFLGLFRTREIARNWVREMKRIDHHEGVVIKYKILKIYIWDGEDE